ncbi:MAG TPA: mannose-1-phosphate guanylyltransferase, partial [Opitutales bacterium]|nr:mannose-1-phosphate guanylyltransferase [Opitutales bacterium]
MAPSRYIVIMAGGRGERFWPQSRQKKPKQLLPIVGEESLLAQTIHRVGGIVPLENIFVITNADYAQAVSEICDMLPAENVVAEPVGRDTAAAVGLSGLLVSLRDPGASLAVLPSDHVIHDTAAFRKVVESAFEVAESGDHLVTIGIAPEFPATGYGYINRGAQCMQIGCLPVYEVKRFVEKPNLETAKHYVASGEFFWNAGMFIWSVKSLDCAMRALAPDIVAIFDGIAAEVRKGVALRDVLAERYPSIRKISIDYAVMEKAKNVVTIPGIFDWDDVGAWPSLVRHLPADSHGNVLRGSAVVLDGSGNIIISSGDHLVSVMGLSNCIV